MNGGKFTFQKINWANLILGRKFSVFLCFTLYFRTISKYKPPGVLIFEGAISCRVFCVTSLGDLYLEELIHGGAYLCSEFYGTYNNLNKNSDDDGGYKIRFCPSFTVRKKI